MTAALSGLPPADGWTVDDLQALPDDGVRRELIDGALHVSPSPTSVHQVIAMRLGVALEQTCPDDLFVSQANDVELSSHRMFIPDVLVTTFEAARRRAGSFMADEVVLAVEIVSPGSQSVDRVLKPALYAKAGIPNFWLIETDGGITVQTHRLNREAGTYEPSGSFTDVISVAIPWPLEVPIAALRPRNF
ncbi:Uma2 family endonuclease [Actinoplanes sp. NPDC048791]|uniref:Uma2 family endonuclease n=1 Tax=Actinoplanes sp. NPDC048791 TaxID=3154623 RepID=UPI0033CC9C47